MTKEDGETVVGWEIPRHDQSGNMDSGNLLTLCDLLSSIHLSNLFLQQLVSFLADSDDLLPSDTHSGNLLEDLLGDDGGTLVFCEGIRVVQGVV